MNRTVPALAALAFAATVAAADLKVLAGSALDAPLKVLIPRFEHASGHSIRLDSDGAIGAMAKRIEKGELADVLIVSPAQLAALEKHERIVAGSARQVARTGVGLFVRKGAPKPDIGSVEALTQTLRRAKSIGYNDPGAGAPVGIYLMELFERLGIAAEIKPKTVVFKQRSERFAAVARGDVEIGFNQIAEILTVPEVDLLGPLPAPIQRHTLFSAAIVSASAQPEAAKAFIDFISSSAAAAVMREKGFE
ncbi:MAG: molybdate ABC transporter substrate-binding protein [Burkholderiales bacterium]